MSGREWLVSAFVVAFLALKLAEGFLGLEAWPLSHVPMFAVRTPPEAHPARRSIHALRGGQWFEMWPWQLGLSPDQVQRRLRRNPDPGVGCGELLRAFNRARPRALQVERAYVRVLIVASPGSGDVDVEQRHECPLAAGEQR